MNFELALAIVFVSFCWSVKLTMQEGYNWLGLIMKLTLMVFSTYLLIEALVRWYKTL